MKSLQYKRGKSAHICSHLLLHSTSVVKKNGTMLTHVDSVPDF